MKISTSKCSYCLFLLIFSICLQELNGITKLDEERIKLAISATQSAAKAMKAMSFVPWVAKIGAVIGPILSAASLVLDIVFMILDIESPEMILMKSEFKNLNNRLDEFSVEFQEVKRKIDWSAIQLNYEKYESIIRVFNAERTRLVEESNPARRKELTEMFIRKFEYDFQMATEVLYNAMSSESILSDNVFEAARVYSHQHPRVTFQFMKGCVQLLMQSMIIQGSYIHLKYNNTEADKYFETLSQTKIASIQKKAKEVYNKILASWHSQTQADVRRIALQNRHLSNKDFSSLLYHYLADKFDMRSWFVIIYNELHGWEEHATAVCGGGIFFRLAGRNIVTASKDRRSKWSKSWANAKLNNLHHFRQDHDGAKGVLERLMAGDNGCNPIAAITVIKLGSNTWYIAESDRVVSATKSVKWCNTELCWVTRTRYYFTIMFG